MYIYIYIICMMINIAHLLSTSTSGQQGELRTSSMHSTLKATGEVVAWQKLKQDFERGSQGERDPPGEFNLSRFQRKYCLKLLTKVQ